MVSKTRFETGWARGGCGARKVWISLPDFVVKISEIGDAPYTP